MEMSNDIKKATEILIEQVDNFAKDLVDFNQDENFVDNSFADIKQPTFNGVYVNTVVVFLSFSSFFSSLMKDALIQEMHKRGINIRYLGLISN